MRKRLTSEQVRARMTPAAPSLEGLRAELVFAEQRLARAGAKLAVAEAEHDASEAYLQDRRDALDAFKAANPDPQMEIFP